MPARVPTGVLAGWHPILQPNQTVSLAQICQRGSLSLGRNDAVGFEWNCRTLCFLAFTSLASQLQEACNITCTGAAETKQLIKELKAKKKELLVQKREKTATITEIKKIARTKGAEAGGTWLGYDSELAASQRRAIRSVKEEALQPLEDARSSTGRQTIKIDKDLVWLERFD